MPLDAQDKLTLESLDNRYDYHAPAGDQPEKYAALRAQCKELAKLIVTTCPSSPERSHALTHLDTVMMFANAAIARNQS